MKILSIVIVWTLSISLASCVFLNKGDQADQQLVQLLMLKSGLDKQLDHYPRMIQSGFEQAQTNSQLQIFTAEEVQMFVGMMGSAYESGKLKNSIQLSLSNSLSSTEIQISLNWLGSPLGEKITKLEEDTSTPEAFEESQAMADRFVNDLARIALITKLNRVMIVTEAAMEAAKYTSVTLLTAVYAEYPADARPSSEEIIDIAEKNTNELRPKLEQMTQNHLLYTYRSVSNEDLEKYISFGESGAGSHYVAACHNAIREALLQATRDFGAQIRKRTI